MHDPTRNTHTVARRDIHPEVHVTLTHLRNRVGDRDAHRVCTTGAVCACPLHSLSLFQPPPRVCPRGAVGGSRVPPPPLGEPHRLLLENIRRGVFCIFGRGDVSVRRCDHYSLSRYQDGVPV